MKDLLSLKTMAHFVDIDGYRRTESLIVDDCPKGEMKIYSYKEKMTSCEAIHKWNISYYKKL